VNRILKKNVYTGIYFFLMVEDKLEGSIRSSTVSEFTERFNTNEKKENQTFNKLHYLYLKNKYPAETANLEIEEKFLYFERFSSKPKDE
jgi:hypothetical protein